MFGSLFAKKALRRHRRGAHRSTAIRRWNPLRLTWLEERAVPASIQVTNVADTGAGSLRAAIIAANGSAGLDTITFIGAAFAGNATITLTSGELAIADSLIINGSTKGVLTVSGNSSSRIFNINGVGTLVVTLNDLTLTKGATAGANDGGAIFVQDENVRLTNCTLSSNNSASDGGAIRLETAAELTIDNCIIQSNTAASAGGAISAPGGPTVTLTDSTFSTNSAIAGGAMNMSVGGTLQIEGCTFAFNFATTSDGGALFLNGSFASVSIRNSTFAGNQAGSDGGAIAISSTFANGVGGLGLQNDTIASNIAINGNGGGIARIAGAAPIAVVSTIVANNSAGASGEDIFTAGTVSAQNSLVETTGGITTFGGDATSNANVGKDPQLGGLSNNGGPTVTLKPALTSPVIDKGSNPALETNDQRGAGYFRVRGIAADIGAVELPDDFVVTNINNSGAGSLRQVILDANAAIGDDTIVFDPTAFAGPQTIFLTSGELTISDDLVITGPVAQVSVSGNNLSRAFNIAGTVGLTVGITDIDMINAKGPGFGGALQLSDDTVTLTGCRLANNSSANSGGAIAAAVIGGNLSLFQCSIENNATSVSGGGIDLNSSTTFLMEGCSITGNVATKQGGGLYAFGSGTVTIRNCTFSGNTAGTDGGGLHFGGTASLTLQNSTIYQNSATAGVGGGFTREIAATTTITSSIVSGNSNVTALDVSSPGTITATYSAFGSPTDFTLSGTSKNNVSFGIDLKLGPLVNNGGATKTHVPSQDSPLLSKGSNPASLTSDQRSGASFPRLRGAGVDIGAVEVPLLLVANTAASGAGSLAQTVLDANAFGGTDTITFDPTVFASTQVINLAGTLNLSANVTIQGPAAKVTLSGVLANRVLFMANGVDYDFSNLNLTLGKASTDGGAVHINQSNADVTFTNCAISINSSATQGGAVATSAASTNTKLTFTDCTLSNNSTTGALQDGGAIHLGAVGTLTLIRTAVTNNTATGDGGGVAVPGGAVIVIQDTTLSGNKSSSRGGAIYMAGSPGAGNRLLNSTISGNQSSLDGGGIGWVSSGGNFFIQNSTVTNNTASAGGGGGVSVTTGTGYLNLESTIISGNINAGAPDIDNPNKTNLKTSAVGSNLGFSKTDLGGNLAFGANLMLSALSNNGGPTQTHVPTTGSPLINVGSNPAVLTTDQRGTLRAISGKVDIGSTEFFDAIVRNTNDSGADSLREVISVSNFLPGTSTITFDATFGSAKTITLTGGELAVTDSVTIKGPTVGVTVSGNNSSRIFEIAGASALTFVASSLVLTQGKVSTGGAAIRAGDDSVTLTDCVVTGNSSNLGSGAIYITQDGFLAATRSIFSANSGSIGGAIGVQGTSPTSGGVFLQDCSVTGNTAASGGGILAHHYFHLFGSTVADNTATSNDGGGIRLEGTFSTVTAAIVNSTISGNSAVDGGAIALMISFTGNLAIANSTITGNTATAAFGGGIALVSGTGSISLESSIVYGNSAVTVGPDISTANSVIVNTSLLGSKSGITTFSPDAFTLAHLGADPLLGPLQNNGGPTQTRLPALDSPAIDNGSNLLGFTTDQRGTGFARTINGLTDIGAVEVREFIVHNTNNNGAGSLRQAVIDANLLPGADTITFDLAVFTMGKTITLTTGELSISDSLTMAGPAAGVTVSGNNASRVFSIGNGKAGSIAVSLSGLTLTGGKAVGLGKGGAILADDEIVTLANCLVTGNNGGLSGGGGISIVGGTLTATDSTFSNNVASGYGGGINAFGGSTTVLQRCMISGNAASTAGGLYADGYLLLENCTVSGNTATGGGLIGYGGGVRVDGAFGPGALTIRNSTITGNSAKSNGGGLDWTGINTGTLVIQNSTITNNSTTAGNGGGIARETGTGVISIESSIVFGNTALTGADLFTAGTAAVNTSLIGSKVGVTTFTGDTFTNAKIGVNPLLGPLANNGGPTLTHLPANNSPAVNAGSNPAALTTEQRGVGFLRSFGGGVDIGAIESRALVVTNTNDAGLGSLRQNILDANAEIGADTITFDPTVFATAKTITLTSGQLNVTDSVTVAGPTVGVTISGNNASRIMGVTGSAGSVMTLENLTLTQGKGSGAGGAVFSNGMTINVLNSTITGNQADFVGGIGVYGADFKISGSTISNNTATGGGAGGLTFRGINATAQFLLENSLVANNSASFGGGMTLLGFLPGYSAVIRNSTFSGNLAGSDGGAVYPRFSAIQLSVQNCTFTGNSAGTSGGAIRTAAGGTMSLESSIVFGNTAPTGPDLFTTGTVTANASLVGSKSGVTTFSGDAFTNANIGVDPLLAPLANNSGPTFTHALLPGSPAINTGSNPAALTTDQRGSGFARVNGGAADIGAFESKLPPTVRKVTINGGEVQRSRVTSVTIDFDSVVTFSGSPVSAFSLKRQSDNLAPLLNTAVVNGATTSVTLVFVGGIVTEFGSLADGRYTLTIDQAKISANGAQLDGDADGAGGDSYVLASTPFGSGPPTNIFRLFGDANGDGAVAASDFIQFRLSFGGINSIFDFDGDGAVAASDFIQFRLRFGGSI